MLAQNDSGGRANNNDDNTISPVSFGRMQATGTTTGTTTTVVATGPNHTASETATATATATAAIISSSSICYDRSYYRSLLKRVNYELKGTPMHRPLSCSTSSVSNNNNNHNPGNNNHILQEARDIARKVGLSIESELNNINIVTTSTTAAIPTTQKEQQMTSASSLLSGSTNIPVSTTTGGYSNTDHIIATTGIDDRTDRINEYKRQYVIRQRTGTNNEAKLYTQKWDKHRIIGERRRRIIRDIDLPNAPIEPPPSGYIIFLGQMTTKLRYDNYKRNRDTAHEQTKIVQEISNMWKVTLNDEDREYYQNFYMNLKKEYGQQIMEYRATGYYTPSDQYVRNHSTVGLWTHQKKHEKNALELEIMTYETIQFPSTHLNEVEQQRRILQSKEKRKIKLQQQRDELLLKEEEQQQQREGPSGTSIIKRRRRRRRSTTGTVVGSTDIQTPNTTTDSITTTTTATTACATEPQRQPKGSPIVNSDLQ